MNIAKGAALACSPFDRMPRFFRLEPETGPRQVIEQVFDVVIIDTASSMKTVSAEEPPL